MDIDRIRDTTPPNTVSQISHSIAITAVKSWQVVRDFFMKAAFVANVGLNSAWSVTKNVASTTKTAVINLVDFSKTNGSKLIDLIAKVIRCTVSFFSNAARVAVDGAIAAKNGAVQGFQISKNFLGAHSKEAMIVGGVVILSSALIYAAYRIHNHEQAAVAK